MKVFLRKVRNASKKLQAIYCRHKRLWLLLFLFSVMSIADIAEAETFGFSLFLKLICLMGVGGLKATVLTLLISPLLDIKKRWTRFAGYSAVAVYGFVSAISFTSFLLYGFGISRRFFTVMFQTNISETAEFIPGLLSNLKEILLGWIPLVMLASLILVFRLIPAVGSKLWIWITGILSLAGILFYSWFFVSFQSGRTAFALSLRIPKYIAETIRSNSLLEELAAKKLPFPQPEKVKCETHTVTGLVIIGESASRGHHSLYGYPLSTTPSLDAISDSLFVFTDAIGSSSATAGNIERILTFKNDDNTYGDWWKYPTVVDLFNNAGFRTFWISNQERTGVWSNSSGVLASTASVVNYTSAEDSEDALLEKNDEIVIPPVTEAISDPSERKLIFCHLMGSHTLFEKRYPKSRRHFSASGVMAKFSRKWLDGEKGALIAHYDNSIRFTDSIVGVMLRQISRLSSPAFVIYFSDHGENVYDDRNFNGRDRKHVEVPFLVFLNRAFIRNFPDMSAALERARKLPVSTANIVYSLMTLCGVRYPLYDPSRDFLSPLFRIRPRYVDESIWEFRRGVSDPVGRR